MYVVYEDYFWMTGRHQLAKFVTCVKSLGSRAANGAGHCSWQPGQRSCLGQPLCSFVPL